MSTGAGGTRSRSGRAQTASKPSPMAAIELPPLRPRATPDPMRIPANGTDRSPREKPTVMAQVRQSAGTASGALLRSTPQETEAGVRSLPNEPLESVGVLEDRLRVIPSASGFRGQSSLGARGRSREGRVARAMGPDARRCSTTGS